jgi:hypothetical protein
MSSHFSRLSVGLLSLSMLVGSTGCGVFGGGSGGTAQLRVMQAAPNVPSVDILIDSAVVVSSLAYGANTGYLSVTSGSRHLQVVPSGSTTPIVDETVSVANSGQVTVIVQGASPNIVGLVLTDNTTAAATGTAQLRVVNASPIMGAADIYAVAAGNPLVAGSPTVAALGVGQVAGYQVLTFPLSTTTTQVYSIYFTTPGTTLVLVGTGPISFTSGQNSTLVALNREGGGSTFTLLTDLN